MANAMMSYRTMCGTLTRSNKGNEDFIFAGYPATRKEAEFKSKCLT